MSFAERAVILDRDGVINQDSDAFIKSPEEWQAIPRSLEAIAMLTRKDYRVFVITNQSGIARGLLSPRTLDEIHTKMCREIAAMGGKLEKIYYCPHGPDDNCRCRKPKRGLFDALAAEMKLSLQNVPAVGDSLRDLQAAAAAGAYPILVKTGKGKKTLRENPHCTPAVFEDLYDASRYILAIQ